jgi:hypothetical protein
LGEAALVVNNQATKSRNLYDLTIFLLLSLYRRFVVEFGIVVINWRIEQRARERLGVHDAPVCPWSLPHSCSCRSFAVTIVSIAPIFFLFLVSLYLLLLVRRSGG